MSDKKWYDPKILVYEKNKSLFNEFVEKTTIGIKDGIIDVYYTCGDGTSCVTKIKEDEIEKVSDIKITSFYSAVQTIKDHGGLQ